MNEVQDSLTRLYVQNQQQLYIRLPHLLLLLVLQLFIL